jgi:hypothetical protein
MSGAAITKAAKLRETSRAEIMARYLSLSVAMIQHCAVTACQEMIPGQSPKCGTGI